LNKIILANFFVFITASFVSFSFFPKKLRKQMILKSIDSEGKFKEWRKLSMKKAYGSGKAGTWRADDNLKEKLKAWGLYCPLIRYNIEYLKSPLVTS